jgi:hypothetical protein
VRDEQADAAARATVFGPLEPVSDLPVIRRNSPKRRERVRREAASLFHLLPQRAPPEILLDVTARELPEGNSFRVPDVERVAEELLAQVHTEVVVEQQAVSGVDDVPLRLVEPAFDLVSTEAF